MLQLQYLLINQIVMKKNLRLEEIRRRISLETCLRVRLQMDDYDNWDNGEYFGDMDKINKNIGIILDEVERWCDKTDMVIYDKNSRFKKT